MSDQGATPEKPPQPPPAAPPAPPAADDAGYWQQQQAAQAASNPPPPSQGIEFNPQSAYPAGDSPPAYPGPGVAPYAQPQYGQPQYGQPQYGQPQYGQPQYGQQYGYYPAYTPPDHPKATTALVLGLIALPGSIVSCGLALLAAPFAWVIGSQARRAIRENPGQYGGSGKATAGYVLGIIGTVLLTLVVAGIIALIVWSASDPSGFDSFWNDDGTTV